MSKKNAAVVKTKTTEETVETVENVDMPDPPHQGSMLNVVAQTDGFRRAGRAWSTTPALVPAADFSAAQLAALRAEPRLTVTFVE